MAEPNTVNVGLIIPNTGDLSGAWGTAALNTDFVQLDGILGGFATISLSSATTISLSTNTGSLTPGAGPYQSANALLKFTGTLTGNSQIRLTRSGFFIIENQCTVGSFYVQIAPSGGTGSGNGVGAPPGQKVHVFYDGTSVDYVNMPPVGSALDLHRVTGLPAWMTACTVLPYLIKDGTVYNVSAYPALGAFLGSTFGGNGVSTFGVPDERNRFRLPLDTNQGGLSNRVTNAVSGVAGSTMGSAGGNQAMQSHNHTATVTDPRHKHLPLNGSFVETGGSGGGNFGGGANQSDSATGTASTGITVAVNGTGSGSSQNMPPTIVSFLPLLKT